MPLWSRTKPPSHPANKVPIATPNGWADPDTLELLVAMSQPPAIPTGVAVMSHVHIGGAQALDGPWVYETGAQLYITVEFNKLITVTGTPELTVTIGSNSRTASYVARYDYPTAAASFVYTIVSADTGAVTVGTASVPAAATFGSSNSAITFTAKKAGTGGNSYAVTLAGNAGTVPLTVTAQDGAVSALSLTATGSNYSVAPDVVIDLPQTSGLRATATATISAGVTSTTTLVGGSGYTSAPTIAFTGGAGSGAAATATITKGVFSFTSLVGGTGYTVAPTISFTGGAGTGAAATATVAAGIITAINVTSNGSGYTSAPTVVITPVSGGSGASATAVLSGYVNAITLTAPGTAYTSAPTIGFSGGAGTGASATAVISGAVNSLTIVNGGSGYTSAPKVLLNLPSGVGGATGSGATATATIADTVTVNLATTSGTPISTVAQIIAAVNNLDIQNFLTASTAGNGTGVVATATVTSLSGGTTGTFTITQNGGTIVSKDLSGAISYTSTFPISLSKVQVNSFNWTA